MSKQKKRWSDLSPQQQRAIVAAGTLQVSLCAAALYDIHRRPASEMNGSKALWTAAAFVNFAGPIAYFAFGRRR